MIVDTNFIISILIEPNESKSQFIKDHLFYAPTLLKLELINVLRKYHFFNNISKNAALDYYENGINIIDQFLEVEQLLKSAIEISFKLNHPIYDCIYLAAAIQNEDVFVSIDKKLLTKAQSLGLKTIDFEVLIGL